MIGLIPAAGKAERMGGLPKFLLPIPGGTLLSVHLDRMATVAREAVVCTSTDNGRLTRHNADGVHVVTADTETMSETMLVLSQYAEDSYVMFGMPDTYFDDHQVYSRLASAMHIDEAEVALALFRARDGQHVEGGMCKVHKGCVTAIVDKPDERVSDYIWGAASWRPSFWQYVQAGDPHIGYALQRAIEHKVRVQAVLQNGGYWDCGTPQRYFELIRRLTGTK